jgi:uncharacterized protein YkwD
VKVGVWVIAIAVAVLGDGITRAVAESSPSGCQDRSTLATPSDLARVDAALLCLINLERRQAGLLPFTESDQLDQSSAFHSSDMVVHHYFAHDRPGRPTLLERIEWSGYFAQARTGLYAENLGYGPQQSTTPEVMVQAWMESPDHRANLLDPRLRDIGVGAALAPRDPAFYAQYPAVVVTTDFGVRSGRRGSCRRRLCAAPARRHARPRPRSRGAAA